MELPKLKRVTNEELPNHKKRLDCFLEEMRKVENKHSIFVETKDLIIIDQEHKCEKCQKL